MNKAILIITDIENQFHCHYKKKTLDLNKIIFNFKKEFKDIEVKTFEEVIADINNIKDKIIIYTSIEKASAYKKNIEDVMYLLDKNNILVPRYDILMCHENKIFQEYYKKYLNYESINALTFDNYLDFYNNRKKIIYPMIYKTKDGSGSIGVNKVNSELDVFKMCLPNILENTKNNVKNKKNRTYAFKANLLNFILKTIPKKYSYNLFKRYYKTIYTNDCQFVLQDFKSGYECDYKVLVYDNLVFTIKRKVRKNDFRASGSGLFEPAKLSPKVLNQIYKFYDLLNTPIGSFDILIDKEETVYLIEYQGIHHGTATIDIAYNYYKKNNNDFKEYKNNKGIEEMFCYAYINYIHKKILNLKS